MDKWSALRFFLATVEGGSFVQAAKQCGTDPSTVSKAVRRLEEELGVVLLQRSTRKLNLTEAGQHYSQAASHTLANLAESELAIRDLNTAPKGTLRINMPVSYGRTYGRPVIESFRKKYPAIDLELHYNDAYVDMIENRFDLAIRTGSVRDSRLIARQLSPIDFIIGASPSFIAQLPENFGPALFDQYPWIRFRFRASSKVMPIYFKQKRTSREFDPDRSIVVDDGVSMTKLCTDGLGLAQMPHYLIRDEIDSGAIIPLFAPFRAPNVGVYIMYPTREFLPKKTSLFVEHLVTTVESIGDNSLSTWIQGITPHF